MARRRLLVAVEGRRLEGQAWPQHRVTERDDLREHGRAQHEPECPDAYLSLRVMHARP